MKYNPFKPGSVVHPGMFVGRMREIRLIEKCLFQTKNGNPQNFLIQGERGIGKSSLVLYAKHLAAGRLTGSYNFVVIKIDLEPHYKFLDIIKKLISEAKIELSSNNIFESIKTQATDTLSKFQTTHLSFSEKETPDNMLVSEISNVLKKISELKKVDGVLVLIDEADKPSSGSELGTFFKLLTERLVSIECNNICIGAAGLFETIDKLRKSHESSLRLFHILSMSVLIDNEREQVIEAGLKEANEKNNFQTKIAKDAKKLIAELSEGYPYFLQQFAYNSFEADDDRLIDKGDIHKGIYDENTGALKQLGEKLFNNIFYNKIGSDNHRKVLQCMATQKQKWIVRSDILKNSGLKATTVNNAIKALKEKQIIFDNPNKKGEYRLPSTSFATWVLAFTQNSQQ